MNIYEAGAGVNFSF